MTLRNARCNDKDRKCGNLRRLLQSPCCCSLLHYARNVSNRYSFSGTRSCVIGYSVPDVSRNVDVLSPRVEMVDFSAVGFKVTTLHRNVGKQIHSDATSYPRGTNIRSTPLQKPKLPQLCTILFIIKDFFRCT